MKKMYWHDTDPNELTRCGLPGDHPAIQHYLSIEVDMMAAKADAAAAEEDMMDAREKVETLTSAWREAARAAQDAAAQNRKGQKAEKLAALVDRFCARWEGKAARGWETGSKSAMQHSMARFWSTHGTVPRDDLTAFVNFCALAEERLANR